MFRGRPLLYTITEERLMTFKSATLARLARISSWMPSVKKTFSSSALRLLNGSTAMDFSGMAGAGVTAEAPAGGESCRALVDVRRAN